MVLRKEVESFIIQEGGKGLEKEELVRDRCVYREKGDGEGLVKDRGTGVTTSELG